jgi:hypothetical protein
MNKPPSITAGLIFMHSDRFRLNRVLAAVLLGELLQSLSAAGTGLVTHLCSLALASYECASSGVSTSPAMGDSTFMLLKVLL